MPAAIVSASHNPWNDNGVKIVGPDGRKLGRRGRGRDRGRAPRSARDPATAPPASARSAPTRRRRSRAVELDAYVAHLLGALDGRTLAGLHVVVDCANGAASELGAARVARGGRARRRDARGARRPQHQRRLRIDVSGGAAARGAWRAAPISGSRSTATPTACVAVDEHGELVDGDQIMVMTALDWHERGMLRNDAIAVTVMSNLGLRRALARGRRRRSSRRRSATATSPRRWPTHDLAIGGEQSGHIVFADLATTGDGVLTGLIVGDLVARRGVPLSALAAAHDAPAAGAGERAARAPGRSRRTPPACRRRCARSRPSSATAAASWCAAREPSRSCG